MYYLTCFSLQCLGTKTDCSSLSSQLEYISIPNYVADYHPLCATHHSHPIELWQERVRVLIHITCGLWFCKQKEERFLLCSMITTLECHAALLWSRGASKEGIPILAPRCHPLHKTSSEAHRVWFGGGKRSDLSKCRYGLSLRRRILAICKGWRTFLVYLIAKLKKLPDMGCWLFKEYICFLKTKNRYEA